MSIAAAEPPTAPPMIAERFDLVEVGSGGLAVLVESGEELSGEELFVEFVEELVVEVGESLPLPAKMLCGEDDVVTEVEVPLFVEELLLAEESVEIDEVEEDEAELP